MKLQRHATVGCIGLLFIALVLIVYGTANIPDPRFKRQLRDLLPKATSDWTIKEKPIADSEELKQAVGELLNFDDGVFVDYLSNSGERVSVYIAYWTPGKMSHRLVATHTPDVCWVGAGWQKLNSARLPEQTTADGTKIPAGESRIFIANGSYEHVWFWHIVGSESKSYGTGSAPPWHAALTDLFRKGLNQREEQFFIRISSPKPLEQTTLDSYLTTIFESIPLENLAK